MRLYAYATFFFLFFQTIPLGKSTYKSFWEKKIYLDMVLVDRIVGKNFELADISSNFFVAIII